MSDPEYAKVTITIETSESVETIMIPRAMDISFGEEARLEEECSSGYWKIQWPVSEAKLQLDMIGLLDDHNGIIYGRIVRKK